MPLKKQSFGDDEIAIYDDAIIYKRGAYWQFRMCLASEHKYARFSLKTRSQSTAEDKAKQHYHALKAAELAGKKYFTLTAVQLGSNMMARTPLKKPTFADNEISSGEEAVEVHRGGVSADACW
jgi:hypothetical protein